MHGRPNSVHMTLGNQSSVSITIFFHPFLNFCDTSDTCPCSKFGLSHLGNSARPMQDLLHAVADIRGPSTLRSLRLHHSQCVSNDTPLPGTDGKEDLHHIGQGSNDANHLSVDKKFNLCKNMFAFFLIPLC